MSVCTRVCSRVSNRKCLIAHDSRVCSFRSCCRPRSSASVRARPCSVARAASAISPCNTHTWFTHTHTCRARHAHAFSVGRVYSATFLCPVNHWVGKPLGWANLLGGQTPWVGKPLGWANPLDWPAPEHTRTEASQDSTPDQVRHTRTGTRAHARTHAPTHTVHTYTYTRTHTHTHTHPLPHTHTQYTRTPPPLPTHTRTHHRYLASSATPNATRNGVNIVTSSVSCSQTFLSSPRQTQARRKMRLLLTRVLLRNARIVSKSRNNHPPSRSHGIIRPADWPTLCSTLRCVCTVIPRHTREHVNTF